MPSNALTWTLYPKNNDPTIRHETATQRLRNGAMHKSLKRSERGVKMLGKLLRGVGRVHLVLLVLAATVLFSEPIAKKYGDRLQVALPMVAWGCAALNRSGTEFAGRFLAMLAITHASKNALGNAPVNLRPSGGDKGFPSAHTAAAGIGASSIVYDCISANPTAKAVVVLSAAFVGASRIDARKHDIWQVLAGGLLGWGADRLVRRPRPRAFVARTAVAATTWALAALRRLWGMRRGNRGRTAALVAALALFASAGVVRAEQELSLYGGVQTAPHSSVTDSVLGQARVRWLGKSLVTPPYYGIRATWWVSEKWGFGAEVNHAKVYADRPASLGYDVLEFTDGLNLVTANIFRRFPNEGRFTPFVGAGLGVAVPNVEIQRSGESRTFGYQITGPAAILVIGTSYAINNKWSVFGEYKGSYSRNTAKVDAGGSFKTSIVTNAINLGISYSF